METRIAELKYKEVISVEDGSRFGFVGDMEIDIDSGQVRALVVPGRRRLFGLLGREEDRYIPWQAVRRFGEDIILVEDQGPGEGPGVDRKSPLRPLGRKGLLGLFYGRDSPPERRLTWTTEKGVSPCGASNFSHGGKVTKRPLMGRGVSTPPSP